MLKQSRLKRKIPLKLQEVSWSEFIVLFNKKHNPELQTQVGIVNVKTKNNFKKKSKKRNR
jgi:predicted protein tyrosine phosphatase